MAEITLRAYLKEIDDLVEHNQLDEAIAHSRRILEIYPKHLGTYRLLGKAYLEAKRYGDAADIFQRVLSAIPDDFVSQIGMAIVREDEGNLDAAIWHMERAFETNPSNPAIQQELRRLISSRDGLEPHKVRMTRGALARMYGHGELYTQAIAELKAALHEDPDRPDLRVLLSTMFWRTDQFVEAAETCNQILERLPYCREANRILAAILQASNKQEEASLYLRRLASIDPYTAYVESASIDPQTVDANAVRIEKLDWQPGQPMPVAEPSQEDWATSLGVELRDEEPDELQPASQPSWLEDLRIPPSSTDSTPAVIPEAGPGPTQEPASSEIPIEQPDSEEPTPEPAEIPEWMQEAGWEKTTGEVSESPISFSDEELSALDAGEPLPEGEPIDEEGELAPADIPGWIKDIAPSEIEAEGDLGEDEGQLPGWLGEIAADVSEIRPEPSPTPAPTPEDEPAPEEIASEVMPDQEISPTIDEADEAVPEEEPAGLPTWLETQEPGATSTIVTWLEERPEAEIPASPEEAIPEGVFEEPETAPSSRGTGVEAWLSGVAEVAAQQDLTSAPPETMADEEVESPDSLERAQEPEEPEIPRETPEWLKMIAEPESPATSDPLSADAPDWLAGIAEDEGETPLVPESQDLEAPDWLDGIAEPDEEVAPDFAAQTEEAPDWLEGIAEPDSVDAISIEDDSSDWLRGFAMEEAEPQPPIETTTEASEIQQPSDEMDDDEIFQWLEGLAARQVVDEEAPPVAEPEERAPEVPEAPERVKAPSAVDDKPIPDEPEESLDWLDRLASQRGLDIDVGVEPAEKVVEPEAELAEPEPVAEVVEPEPPIVTVEPEPAPEAVIPEPVAEVIEVEPTAEVVEQEPVAEVAEAEPVAEAIEPEPVAEIVEPVPVSEVTEPEPVVVAVEPEPPAEIVEPESVAEIVETEPAFEVVEPAAKVIEPEPEIGITEPEAVEEAIEIPEWLESMATTETHESPPELVTEATDWLGQEKEPEPSPQETDAMEMEEAIPEVPAPTPIQDEPEWLPMPEGQVEPTKHEATTPPAEPTIETPSAVEDKPEPPKPVTPDLLDEARQALAADDIENAVSNYTSLIKQKKELDAVIEDLRLTLERDPNVPALWQVLGDAYMKNEQLPKAIAAYQRGTEVS